MNAPLSGTRLALIRAAVELNPGTNCEDAYADRAALLAEVDRLRGLISSPVIDDFMMAVPLEAAHAVERWGTPHDENKSPADWGGVIMFLGGKAIAASWEGDFDKFRHHIITTAGACLNWYRYACAQAGIEPRTTPLTVGELLAALTELVECKDIKDRLDRYEAGSTDELAAMAEEYSLRKPTAWDTARALVALSRPPPAPQPPKEYCEHEDCVLPKGHEGEHCDLPF